MKSEADVAEIVTHFSSLDNTYIESGRVSEFILMYRNGCTSGNMLFLFQPSQMIGHGYGSILYAQPNVEHKVIYQLWTEFQLKPNLMINRCHVTSFFPHPGTTIA